MSIHSAITAFLDQSPSDITASTLSCLSSSLFEASVARALIEQHRPVCKEVMSRLVTVANDGGKNLNARVMALECLYVLSHVPNAQFCTGDLLDAVQRLNESFEEFLTTQSIGDVSLQHEMLTVLLFRCSGYTRLRAGDLLQQLYNGEDTRLVATLLTIIKNNTLEWEIVDASIRCLYELTTPVSYFSAPEGNQPIETTKITAFQDRITALLIHFSQNNVFQELFHEVGTRWAVAVHREGLDSVMERRAEVTAGVRDGVAMNFVSIFRHLAVMLLNVSDFCGRQELVRAHQQSFMAQHQGFLAGTVIPFVRLALRCWESTLNTEAKSQEKAFMHVTIAVLRLLRFALYRFSEPPQESLIASLVLFTRQVLSLEPQLVREYVGMLVLVLTVELLCNANALHFPPLAAEFTALVRGIAKDKNPCSGVQLTVAQAFAYCLANESSAYCVSENESVTLLQQTLREEDVDGVCEVAWVMQTLGEHLAVLQSLMMDLAVGEFLTDVCLFFPMVSAAGETAEKRTTPPAAAPPKNSAAAAPSKKSSRPKTKLKHPARYVCMLTKKLMREPVVLRNGHHFELDALQEVVDRVGHVDPLTGEAFNDELQVDMDLQQEIARYRIEMAASKESRATA